MKTQTELLHLLSEDRIDDLFVELGPHSDQILMLKGKWNNLRNQEAAGTAEQDDLDRGYAQVRQGLLQFIKHGEAPAQSVAPRTEPSTGGGIMRYLLWALGGAGVLALGFVLVAINEPDEIIDTHEPQETKQTAAAATKAQPTATEAVRNLALPAITEYKFRASSQKVTFQILEITTEQISDENTLLRIKVMCSNNGSYPLNFWNDSFRLTTDANPSRISPVSDLNEVVDGDTDKTGEVEFEIPASAKTATLQIKFYGNESKVQIGLE